MTYQFCDISVFFYHLSFNDISVSVIVKFQFFGTFQFWWHFSFDLDHLIWTRLFKYVCLTQFLDLSIWIHLFWPVHLTRLLQPIFLDPSIWTILFLLFLFLFLSPYKFLFSYQFLSPYWFLDATALSCNAKLSGWLACSLTLFRQLVTDRLLKRESRWKTVDSRR